MSNLHLTKTIARATLCIAAGAAVMSAQADITLRFTTWDGNEGTKYLKPLIHQFEKEHKGVHVRMEFAGDYTLYHQKRLIEYAANVAPDVSLMDPPNFQALAKRGALLPLNDMFKYSPGLKISDYYKPIVDTMSMNGKLYVLPRDISPIGIIYYNKKAFREAGIPYPDGSWTWDFHPRPELREKDFIWVMQQLTKKDPKTGKVSRYAFGTSWPQLLWSSLSLSYGARNPDNNEHPTKPQFDTPGMIKVYQFGTDIWHKYKWVPSNTEVNTVLQSTAIDLFSRGQIAMFETGIYDVNKIRDEDLPNKPGYFDWDITTFPAYVGRKPLIMSGGSGYCVFSSTKYPKIAWELASYLAGPRVMTEMTKTGLQPAIASLARSTVWLPSPDKPARLQSPANLRITDDIIPYCDLGVTADYWKSVNDAAGAPLDRLVSGSDTDAAAALHEAQKLAERRLAQLTRDQSNAPFPWSMGLAFACAIVCAILGWVYWPERLRKYTSKERLESRAAYRFLSPWLLGMVIFTVGPMILSLLMSFADWDIIRPATWRGMGNYHEALYQDNIFWVSMKVTAIFTLVGVPLGLVFSLLLALLLNQKVKGIPLFRALYYIPSLASGMASALVWRRIFNPDNGLLNSLLYSKPAEWVGITHLMNELAAKSGEKVNWLSNEKTALAAFIMMGVWGVGGSTIILLAGLQGVPQFYYEAATVDGANAWHKFRAVTLPLVTPALFFTMITGFIGSFQSFTQAFVMTQGGPNNATMLYMLNLYNQAFTSLRMGYASALAWILFLVILVFSLVQVTVGNRWVYYEADVK